MQSAAAGWWLPAAAVTRQVGSSGGGDDVRAALPRWDVIAPGKNDGVPARI
jgi:hypothetical protein